MDKLLKLDNLTDVLQRFADELEREYKQNLKDNNRIATGTLYNTAKCEVIKGEYVVVFHLQDYWRHVEAGRDKTLNNGDGALRRNILKWIEVKKILPKPINGKLPTPQQLAYIISKKIHEKGYKGTQDLSKATDDIWDKYREEIYDAIDKDFDTALINIFKMKPLNI